MPSAVTFSITDRMLFAQVRRDILGKEVLDGYTLTYVWLANQLGHFTLGFGIHLLVMWLLGALWPGLAEAGPSRVLAVAALALLQLAGWSYKEWCDYRQARDDWVRRGGPFPFAGTDVFKDAATAVLFIAFGLATACAGLLLPGWALGVFIACALIASVPARYWLKRKYCLQRAAPPYQVRLCDFDGRFAGDSKHAVTLVRELVARAEKRRVLLVFGERGSGRSLLAAGILVDRCFDVHPARYLAWAKFIEGIPASDQLWCWKESDIVVLDDVEPDPDVAIDALRSFPLQDQMSLVDRSLVLVLQQWSESACASWTQGLRQALGESLTVDCLVLVGKQQTRGRRWLSRFLGH